LVAAIVQAKLEVGLPRNLVVEDASTGQRTHWAEL
jgi:hypothetical protein